MHLCRSVASPKKHLVRKLMIIRAFFVFRLPSPIGFTWALSLASAGAVPAPFLPPVSAAHRTAPHRRPLQPLGFRRTRIGAFARGTGHFLLMISCLVGGLIKLYRSAHVGGTNAIFGNERTKFDGFGRLGIIWQCKEGMNTKMIGFYDFR